MFDDYTTKNYGKSESSMGKSTISTWPFSIATLVCQGVDEHHKILRLVLENP